MRSRFLTISIAGVLVASLGGIIAPPLAAHAAAPASITGRVLSNGGEILKGVTVQAKNTTGELYTTLSDSKGRFYLTGLKSGTYGLKFSDRVGLFPCLESSCFKNGVTEWLGDSPSFSDSDKIALFAGQKHTGVRVLFDTQARLSGQVTVNGRPSTIDDGVAVKWYRNGKTFGASLTEGSWYADAERVGNYRFRVYSTNDAFAPFWIVDPRDGNTTFHIDLIEKITGIPVAVSIP
jgi:hypothetical protein